MEERKSKRALRNNTSCAHLQNIFKNKQYVFRSASKNLPSEILQKVARLPPALTCDDINSLTFANYQSPIQAITKMRQVITIQKQMVNKRRTLELSAKMNQNKLFRNQRTEPDDRQRSRQKHSDNGRQPRMIKSEQPQFQYKYEKYGGYDRYGQQILYNQLFRNDLQNLFIP